MRVLVSSVGTRGDVQPALALAIELHALGHTPRLCVPPNFIAWSARLGLEAVPVGIEMRQARGASMPTPEQARQLAEDLIANQFDAVGAAAKGCELIVGAGAYQYAACSIAELEGTRYVNALYAPVSLRSAALAPPAGPGQAWETGEPAENLRRWEAYARSWNDRSLERVNRNRARLGLGAIDDVLSYISTDRPWLAADPLLGPAPGTDVFQTGAWLLSDPRPLPAELEAFLTTGDAPIYFGLGSMPAAQETSRAWIEAARALGHRAIVSRGWAELAIDDAEDCIAIGDVDHALLFPRVAAVVHHGGAGTTTAVARAGVPQVVTPMFSDQFYWASRVCALGIGSTPAESLTSALRAVLAPEVTRRVREMAKEIVTNGAAVAAARLVDEHAQLP